MKAILLLSPLLLALAQPACARDIHDWDGQWVLFHKDAAGALVPDKFTEAYVVKNGRGVGAWTGCVWAAAAKSRIEKDRAIFVFGQGGEKSTLTLTRTGANEANGVFSKESTAYVLKRNRSAECPGYYLDGDAPQSPKTP